MLQTEFTQRTQIWVTEELFNELHKQYVASPIIDKDAWCRQYKRKHELDITKAMVDEIMQLRAALAEEQQKRVLERRHADKELLEARKTGNAYAEELMRIYDVKGDDKAMREMLAKVLNKYNK